MGTKLIALFCSFFCLCFLIGCTQQPTNKSVSNPSKEQLINANLARLEQESEIIDAYIKRKKLDMKKSGTGLRYQIIEPGNGNLATQNQMAIVHYKVFLLNGKLCYSSDQNGPQKFIIGRDYVETGLHEGILLLKKGGKAIFILPSHLAHGLTGDNNQIPGNSPVVYEIELVDLK